MSNVFNRFTIYELLVSAKAGYQVETEKLPVSGHPKISRKKMQTVFSRIERGEKLTAQKINWLQLNAKIRRIINSNETRVITLDHFLNNISIVSRNL